MSRRLDRPSNSRCATGSASSARRTSRSFRMRDQRRWLHNFLANMSRTCICRGTRSSTRTRIFELALPLRNTSFAVRIQAAGCDHCHRHRCIPRPAARGTVGKDHDRLVKTQTLLKELRVLNAILNFAVSRKSLADNPMTAFVFPRVLDSKPHHFHTADDMALLYEACVEPWHAATWKLFANTGLRRTEGMLLERRWVGQDGLKVVSTEEDRTKSGKWRDVPLFPRRPRGSCSLAKIRQIRHPAHSARGTISSLHQRHGSRQVGGKPAHTKAYLHFEPDDEPEDSNPNHSVVGWPLFDRNHGTVRVFAYRAG